MIVFRYNQGTSENYHHKIAVIPASGGTSLYTFDFDPRARESRIQFTPDGKTIALLRGFLTRDVVLVKDAGH